MPVTAVASFAHRVSGALLVLAIPASIYTLQVSLRDASGYGYVRDVLVDGPGRLVMVLLAWALTHHLLAGLRFLAQDLGVGFKLRGARLSAWIVNVVGVLMLALVAWGVWK